MNYDQTLYNFTRGNGDPGRKLSVYFNVEKMVRDLSKHVGRFREELPCQSDRTNSKDTIAVVMIKDEWIVGHIPRYISAVCLMFPR